MKRRDFLGRIAQALALLGISDAGWLRLSDRYYQALAQPTRRKLALLVGINQYPSIQPLSGCLTDVELQKELLIHRFGYQEADILTLSDRQATRQQIETAFLEHLTKQAQKDDVVVFHFSGYGRRVEIKAEGALGEMSIQNPKSKIDSSLIHNSLIPVDGVLPASGVAVANDLLDETLWQLLRSLSTTHITTILDTSFNTPLGTLLPGNLRVRSFPQATQEQISTAELAFQQQIHQNFLCTPGFNSLNCDNTDNLFKLSTSIPGVVLVAAGSTQSATEAKWNDFSAGLFTYALTQYLWEVTPAPTVQVSFNRVTGTVEQLVGKEQQPQLGLPKNQVSELAYHLSPDPNISADGAIKLVEDGKTAQLWLAGIPPTVLEYYEVGSKLSVVAPEIETRGDKRAGGAEEAKGAEGENAIPNSKSKIGLPLLQVRSRTGLIAKAQLVDSNDSLQVGQLVQEAVRVLPRNIRLLVALDPNLERIERVDATSAFATVSYVSLVTAGEQLADYVFGRVSETKPADTAATILSSPPPNRYGLFSLDRQLVPNTAGELGEAAKVAVQRLAPKLQTLLAAKLWRLTTNEGSSLLNVKASLEIVNAPQQVVAQRESLRLKSEPESLFSSMEKLYAKATRRPNATTDSIPIPIGSRIQYRVRNDSDRPVYLMLLGLDPNKNAIALYSTQLSADSADANPKPLLKNVAIAPGETLIVPQMAVDFEWIVHKPTGLAEHQLIFSTAELTQTLATMAAAQQDTSDRQYIGALSNPLEVTQAMLQDLHNASAIALPTASSTTEAASSTTDTYSLDVTNWASFSFVYQVTRSEC